MSKSQSNKFIYGAQNTKFIHEMLVCNSDLCVAIAFWGEDSIRLIQNALRKFPSRKIKIICNVTSGATNPRFVKFCIENSDQIQIKNSSNLHSKVMLTLTDYIVGSTNISSNGLGHEDDETNGWMESSITGNDTKILNDARKWFKLEWQRAEKISDKMIFKAEDDWKKRRINRVNSDYKNGTESKPKYLIDAILKRPQHFKERNIYLAIFRSYKSREANQEHESYKREKFIKNLASYENWKNIPPDSYLIDIYWGARGGIDIHKMNYIPNHPHLLDFKYDDGDDGTLLLGSVVDEIEGFKFFCDKNKLSKKVLEKLFELGDGDEEGKIVDVFKVCEVLSKE